MCCKVLRYRGVEVLERRVIKQGLLLERHAIVLCLQCAIKCNWRLLYASLLFRVVQVSFLCIFLRGWLVYSAEYSAETCSH